jgi:hypothetical protein
MVVTGIGRMGCAIDTLVIDATVLAILFHILDIAFIAPIQVTNITARILASVISKYFAWRAWVAHIILTAVCTILFHILDIAFIAPIQVTIVAARVFTPTVSGDFWRRATYTRIILAAIGAVY